jgi:hypothetical protein
VKPHLEELHNEGNDKEPKHLPKGAVMIECYKVDDRIYILGQPDDKSDHNCDYAGCGREHVLHVFPVIVGCSYNKVKP